MAVRYVQASSCFSNNINNNNNNNNEDRKEERRRREFKSCLRRKGQTNVLCMEMHGGAKMTASLKLTDCSFTRAALQGTGCRNCMKRDSSTTQSPQRRSTQPSSSPTAASTGKHNPKKMSHSRLGSQGFYQVT